MHRLNITITSTLRHNILKTTLESFRQNLFEDYNRHNLYINIDPVGDSDIESVKNTVLSFHSNPTFITPEKANFALAVKNLWGVADINNKITFHLEDDWIILKKININEIIEYIERKNLVWLNLRCSMKGYNSPSLGQSFVRTEYLKKMSSLMNDMVCPETQIKAYKCRNGTYMKEILIEDIGRVWRKERGIKRSGNKKSQFIEWEF